MMVRCTDKLSLFAAPATLDVDWDISPDAFEEVTSRSAPPRPSWCWTCRTSGPAGCAAP
jgi:pilus assembly protein CpaE